MTCTSIIITIIITIIIIIMFYEFIQQYKKISGGYRTSFSVNPEFYADCIDNMTNAYPFLDRVASRWCHDNIEILYENYKPFCDCILSSFNRETNDDKSWFCVPVAEALVAGYSLGTLLTFVRLLGHGGFNIAFEVHDNVLDTNLVLRIYKIRSENNNNDSINATIHRSIESLRETIRIFGDCEYFVKIYSGSHTFRHRTNPYNVATYWVITKKYDENTFELLRDSNKQEKYLEAMVTIRHIAHTHHLIYIDWKISNFMYDSVNDKFVLTDIEFLNDDYSESAIPHTHVFGNFNSPQNCANQQEYWRIVDNMILLKEMGCIHAPNVRRYWHFVKYEMTVDELYSVCNDLINLYQNNDTILSFLTYMRDDVIPNHYELH